MIVTRLRPLAEVDLVEPFDHYRHEGGDHLGERFFDAALAALDAIGRMPGAGSGELRRVPGLRFRRAARLPCSWFYFVATDHIDVVRLLAEAQDLPAILADTERK